MNYAEGNRYITEGNSNWTAWNVLHKAGTEPGQCGCPQISANLCLLCGFDFTAKDAKEMHAELRREKLGGFAPTPPFKNQF